MWLAINNKIPVHLHVPTLGYVQASAATPILFVFTFCTFLSINLLLSQRKFSIFPIVLLLLLTSTLKASFPQYCELLLSNDISPGSKVVDIWLAGVKHDVLSASSSSGSGSSYAAPDSDLQQIFLATDNLPPTPLTVSNVLTVDECKLIGAKVFSLKSEWVQYEDSFFLPEFRLGGFPIHNDTTDNAIRVSQIMKAQFECDANDILLYSKMATAFESIFVATSNNTKPPIKALQLDTVGHPGFQIQYSNFFYSQKVFQKHVDWVGDRSDSSELPNRRSGRLLLLVYLLTPYSTARKHEFRSRLVSTTQIPP